MIIIRVFNHSFLTHQIKVMNKNIGYAANIVERCPSCLGNLVRHICDMTCAPHQSSFMRPKRIEEGEKGKFSEI